MQTFSKFQKLNFFVEKNQSLIFGDSFYNSRYFQLIARYFFLIIKKYVLFTFHV